MADEPKALEELMVSTLAMTDASAKLSIAMGIITDARVQNPVKHGAGELFSRAEAETLTPYGVRHFFALSQRRLIKIVNYGKSSECRPSN